MIDLRRIRYRFLVALTGAHRWAPRVRRTLLVVVAVITAGLGLWGWFLFRDQHRDADIDGWTIAYGTFSLFTGNGEIQPVPTPMAVARLLAPLSTAGVALEVVLTVGAGQLRNFVARRAVDHTVVVGPPQRARPYLSSEAMRAETIVHVGPQPGGEETHVIHVSDNPSREWWATSNAVRARQLVLTRGRDDLNLQALAAALDRGMPSGGQRLLVEVDDPALRLRLAVALTRDHPGAAIDVVCVDQARADLAAMIIADEVLRSTEHSQADRPPSKRSSEDVPSIAVVGDGALSRQLVRPLADSLRHASRQTSASRPRVAVIDPDPASRERTRQQVLHEATLDTIFLDDLGGLLGTWAVGPSHAVVDFTDPLRSARVAFDLAWHRPKSRIWLACDEPIALPGAYSRTIPLTVAGGEEHLVGVFTRVAQLDHADRAARGLGPTRTRPDGTDEAIPWAALGEEARQRAVKEVRVAVSVLVDSGYSVVPTEDVGPSGAHAFVVPDVRERLRQERAAGADDPAALIRLLSKVGLAIPRSSARP